MEKIAKIKGVLRDLGITQDLKGYHYIAKAASMIAEDVENGDIPRGITTIYYEIGNHFSVTHASVERCMRHCIFVAKRNNPEYYNKLFGKINRVTVSNFVSIIAECV